MSSARQIKHAPKDDWREAYVEEKIRPLVKSLNNKKLGIRTIAACQGHPCGNAPYIMFECPPELAGRMQQKLDEISGKKAPLNYWWRIDGVFNAEYELRFTLSSKSLERWTYCSLRAIYILGLSRRKIDADMNIIAETMINMFSEIKTGKVKKITEIDEAGGDYKKTKKYSPVFVFYLLTKWVRCVAARARKFGISIYGKFTATYVARFKHKKSPIKRNKKNNSHSITFFLVVILLLNVGLSLGVEGHEIIQSARKLPQYCAIAPGVKS
jgi:hypothetical protein